MLGFSLITRVEANSNESDKHSSLLQYGTNYSSKSIIIEAPGDKSGRKQFISRTLRMILSLMTLNIVTLSISDTQHYSGLFATLSTKDTLHFLLTVKLTVVILMPLLKVFHYLHHLAKVIVN